jgi:hypothetical protein
MPHSRGPASRSNCMQITAPLPAAGGLIRPSLLSQAGGGLGLYPRLRYTGSQVATTATGHHLERAQLQRPSTNAGAAALPDVCRCSQGPGHAMALVVCSSGNRVLVRVRVPASGWVAGLGSDLPPGADRLVLTCACRSARVALAAAAVRVWLLSCRRCSLTAADAGQGTAVGSGLLRWRGGGSRRV